MAADQEIVQALGSTDLFSGVSKRALNAIADQARVVRHEPGKEITEEGGGAVGFHLIREGEASVDRGTARASPRWARATTSARSR